MAIPKFFDRGQAFGITYHEIAQDSVEGGAIFTAITISHFLEEGEDDSCVQCFRSHREEDLVGISDVIEGVLGATITTSSKSVRISVPIERMMLPVDALQRTPDLGLRHRSSCVSWV